LIYQEINKINPVAEQRAAAVDKVEQMRNERKITPNFTLQTRRKVNDAELEGARGNLKKVGGLDELEVKLTKINQEVCSNLTFPYSVVYFPPPSTFTNLNTELQASERHGSQA
jgi:hypothetical protein